MWIRANVAIVLLAACAGPETEYARANATWTPDYEPQIIYVNNVHAACRNIGTPARPDETIYGCSDPWGRVVKRRCLVMLPHDAPQWLTEHEMLHCKYGRFH